ncbi:hypothetical protein HMPREF1092_00895 [Clostridium thermobutyricum]|uniref:Uncharacterized protein n=1 Tax=Clostridium thermobutyricum TaxID=29372 RepID=N9WF44_9CLOT|nr:hypothetical protein [Clostridium thermobutyricum]ENZ01661.1 hypothetical protein HMPREF1092_00895 [Clostridium thermobutyricum]
MNRVIKKCDFAVIGMFWSVIIPPTIFFYITSMATVHDIITFIEVMISFTLSIYLPIIFFRISILLEEKEE